MKGIALRTYQVAIFFFVASFLGGPQASDSSTATTTSTVLGQGDQDQEHSSDRRNRNVWNLSVGLGVTEVSGHVRYDIRRFGVGLSAGKRGRKDRRSLRIGSSAFFRIPATDVDVLSFGPSIGINGNFALDPGSGTGITVDLLGFVRGYLSEHFFFEIQNGVEIGASDLGLLFPAAFRLRAGYAMGANPRHHLASSAERAGAAFVICLLSAAELAAIGLFTGLSLMD